MHAAIATQRQPGLREEDWAGVLVPGLAVVLDGLSAPDGTGTGCRHGTPWYVSQLGPRLLALAADPTRSLVDALAEAIQQVASLHPGCDLKHPGAPSATLVLLRALDEGADYLALADAVLLLDTIDGLKVVGDERVYQLAGPVRNAKPPTGYRPARPSSSGDAPSSPGRCGGHATNPGLLGRRRRPQAASQAITGSLPSKSLHRAVLLSDGASRLADPFKLATWEELVALLDESGPDELLRQVRAAEAVDPEGRQWPRTKRSDDATAVYLVLDRAASPQP